MLGWGLIRIISRTKGGIYNFFSRTEEGIDKTESVRNGMNRQRIHFTWDHLNVLFL